jgi:signal peptide peptidase SppA
MNELVDLSAFDLAIARNLLSEYFGPWAILPDRFEQLVQRVNQLNIRSHIAAHQANYQALGQHGDFNPSGHRAYMDHLPSGEAKSDSETPYALSQGIAQIEMIGPMMKFASSISSNVSTVYVRKQLRHAAKNPDVKAIVLRIDSPGGTVSGTKDLADEILKAKATKPVIAFVEDLAASAAYWIAAQTNEIVANNTTALIGSIGTYTVIYDYSRQAENLGIKTHVIATGKHKGAGVPGSPITPEQLADFQRVIDSLNDQFKSAVAEGRKLSQGTIDELADGRVHPASVALDLKLIDRIESFDAVVNRYAQPIFSSRRAVAMTTEIVKPESQVEAAASIDQLKKICSDSEFVLQQLEQKATVAQATSAYNIKLKAELEATKAKQADELAKARAESAEQARVEAAEIAKKAAGVKPITCGSSDPADDDSNLELGDVSSTYESLVEKRMARMSNVPEDERRRKAIVSIAKSNPQLHQSYLASINDKPKLKRLLAEKYAG